MIRLPLFFPFSNSPYGELTENSDQHLPPPFYHTRRYIDQCASEFYGLDSSYRLYKFKNLDVREKEKALASTLGFGSLDKFKAEQQEWLDARKPIPIPWLEELGMSKEMLDTYVTMDFEQNRLALLERYMVTKYIVSIPPLLNVYKSFRAPKLEHQVLEHIQSVVDIRRYPRAYCKIGHMRVYHFEPDKPWNIYQAKPEVIWGNAEATLQGYLGFRNWEPIGQNKNIKTGDLQ